MMVTYAESHRHLYRDRDRAVLGGVCAGLANYLGFNLKVTRFLAFIAFLTMMPVAIVAYLAAVFLIPSESHGDSDIARKRDDVPKRCFRRGRKARKVEVIIESPGPSVADEIDDRCQSMDERLKRLEKHVTSKRFRLDQELSRL